jgi:dipeptidyl aminopeptidase/acylaminoacyl peptidase
MKYFAIIGSFLFVATISFAGGLLIGKAGPPAIARLIKPSPTPVPTPLAQYQIYSLSSTSFTPGTLTLSEPEEAENKDYTTHTFEFTFRPAPNQDFTKKTTGQVNIPAGEGDHSIVLMLRGFVPQEIYTTGIGTQNAANFFAQNGYLTIAPDFLGYAGSSEESGDIFETRFQTYTTILSLIGYLRQNAHPQIKHNNNIFIWAHSNGGQIALTALAATGELFPTTLWAPVTKPFPYSVLYYTDEAQDGGKFLRKQLALFEEVYDTDRFTFTNYLDQINAPLLIHQGTSDDAVPVAWTDNFVQKLKSLEKEIEYERHAEADHNMRGSWDEAVQQDLDFFIRHTK